MTFVMVVKIPILLVIALLSCLSVVSCENNVITAKAASHWILDAESGMVHDINGYPLKTGCDCNAQKYACGCCASFDFPKIGLNDTGCVNITYLPEQYGISFFVTIDGKVYLNETVSAKNPPPICFGVPYLETAASICVDFYNLDYSKTTFSGCIKIEARLYHVLVEDLDLGCFKIPLSRSAMVNTIDYEEKMTAWLMELKKQQEKKRTMLGFN